MYTTYTAMPALPAEQQDTRRNPSGGPLGWVVVRSYDDHAVGGFSTYIDQVEAQHIAEIMNRRAS
jgi:hypothetical protein